MGWGGFSGATEALANPNNDWTAMVAPRRAGENASHAEHLGSTHDKDQTSGGLGTGYARLYSP